MQHGPLCLGLTLWLNNENAPSPSNDAYITEDSNFYYVTEDGSSYYITES